MSYSARSFFFNFCHNVSFELHLVIALPYYSITTIKLNYLRMNYMFEKITLFHCIMQVRISLKVRGEHCIQSLNVVVVVVLLLFAFGKQLCSYRDGQLT